MPVDKSPDVWHLIFEQTPQALRWFLGIATLGVFTLLSILYRWHRNDMHRVERRIDHLDERIDHHMSEQNKLLTQIAQNTGRRE